MPADPAPLFWHRLPGRKAIHLMLQGTTRSLCPAITGAQANEHLSNMFLTTSPPLVDECQACRRIITKELAHE